MIMKTSAKIVYCLLAFTFLYACSDKNEASEASGSIAVDGKELNQVEVGQEASVVTISIEANLPWILESDKDWCRPAELSGGATTAGSPKKVQISIEQNTEENSRTAKVLLIIGDFSKKIEIVQDAYVPVEDPEWESAATAVLKMHVGWNLGNTLDSWGEWIDEYTERKPSDYETAWGQPVTSPEMIAKFKEAGFNAIRVPVTWFPHMDGNDVIEEAWMQRVEEVVNYVLNADMYCILNVHHDTGTEGWIRADWATYATISTRFKKLWGQIATRFQKYDKHLLFESYNEMLDMRDTWNDTNADGYKAQNALAQDFVDVVRQSGGNNVSRNLVVNTYSAATSALTLNSFIMPTDVVKKHLLAQVHVYSPYSFALDESAGSSKTFTKEGEKEVDDIMSRLNERFCKQDIPVIIGECGAVDKNNTAERVKQAAYTVKAAKNYGIVCFRWMGLLDRATLQWSEPEIMEAIIENAK